MKVYYTRISGSRFESIGRSTGMPELRYLIAPCHQQHDKGDPCMIIFADRIER